MLYFETKSNKPEFNLACEEYFLRNYTEPILMLWQNEPTIVVGRFQNTLEEINEDFTKEKNINVIRRMTGGGAVYHDFGNLCYSFIVRGVEPENADFSVFAKPIVKALQELGLDAYTSGRNDILIDEKKISGTAMSLYKDSLLFHGTLLFDSDLSVLAEALRVNPLKIQSKSSKSVRSRVTNISAYLNEKQKDAKEFQVILKDKLYEAFAFSELELRDDDLAAIEKLAEEKYKSWEWNIGNNPQYSIKNCAKFDGGLLEINVDVQKGTIKDCLIRGDFLGLCSLTDLENALCDQKYEKDVVEKILQRFDIKKHFSGITMDEIIACMFGK